MNRWIVYSISHFCGVSKHLVWCDLKILVSHGFMCEPQQLQTELTFCGSVMSSICVYVFMTLCLPQCVYTICVCVRVRVTTLCSFFQKPKVANHFPILKPRLPLGKTPLKILWLLFPPRPRLFSLRGPGCSAASCTVSAFRVTSLEFPFCRSGCHSINTTSSLAEVHSNTIATQREK